MPFPITPSADLFRVIGGVCIFITAVLLWSALATEDYVTNHLLLTLNFNGNLVIADQYFTLGAYHLCSRITYYNDGHFLGGTSTHCPSIGDSCDAYLQLQGLDGVDIYPEPGLPLVMGRSCSTFLAGRSFLIIAALGFTFVSLFMLFLQCGPCQRLMGRWSQAKVDRGLVIEAVGSVVVALVSILCQPENVNDGFNEDNLCDTVQQQSSTIIDCQTPTSTWGASLDMHAVAIVIGALGCCFYYGGWRMGLKSDLNQPLVDNDRGEMGGGAGGGGGGLAGTADSAEWRGTENAVQHSYP
jgi:hypothetical protein